MECKMDRKKINKKINSKNNNIGFNFRKKTLVKFCLQRI